MSRIKKIIALVSLIMALLLAVETPVSALTPVIKQSETSAISAEDQEYAFGDSSEEVVTSDLILGEIEGERTEYTKSFRLENGNNMIVQYDLPIHYQNDEKEWVDYDYSMVSSEKEITVTMDKATADEVEIEKRTIEVYSAKNSYQNISFAKNPNENSMAFIEDEDSSVSWEYADMNRTAAKVIETKNEYEGNDRYTVLDNLVSTIKYESAYPNVDIECISSPIGVKENIILRNPSAANSYTAIYHIGDLTAKQLDEKNIVLLNKDDEAEYYISTPYMFDAKNNTSEDIKLRILHIADGNLTVELVADNEWLNEKDRSYPVTLDPTFIASREWGEVQCAFLDINHPNTAYGYGSSTGYTGTIYVGGYSTEAYRALIKMNNLPALNPGDIIVDATVNLIPFNYDYSANMYVGVYEATSSWNQSTVTWNNQPSCSGTLIDYSNMYTDLIDYSYYSWNITSLVKKWYNGTTNNGFYLKAATSTSFDQAAGFYSSNYPYGQGLRPAFALTYRNNKGIEGYWSYNTFDVGSAGTMYVNDYSGALTFVTSLASTASPIMPTSVSYIYNSYMAGTLYGRSLPNVGKGWKLNIQQNILPSSQFGLSDDAQTQYPYVYIDSDGTEHYFYKKSENGVTKYLDEDGLHLELTIQKTNNTVTGYTITDQDKNKMVFDSNGVLESTEDVYENSVNISKTIVTVNNTQRTKITSISDASSNTIGFDLNSNNYISNLTDPSNRVTSISYGTVAQGTAGCITSITRSDGTTVYFTYDSSGLMTSITDCDGYKIEITYDSSSSKKYLRS